jgi:membrane associated rhomboid family serine protease
VTWALAAANTAIFALVLGRGDPGDPDLLVRLGALERGRVWEGEVWRLVSAAFLHGGWQHLAMNVGALLLAGVIVERALGPARTLGLYVASAVGASAASLLAHDAVVAGASGGVFGLVGALLSLELHRSGSLRRFLSGPHTLTVLGALALGLVASRIFPAGLPADDFAHAGGLATGAAAAWLLTRPTARSATWPWAFGLAFAAAVTAAVWPRPGTSRFQAAALERELHAALRREDAGEARRLLLVAHARPALASARLLRRARPGARRRSRGSLQALRGLSTAADAPLHDEVRRAAARIARVLGYRHSTGDGHQADPGAPPTSRSRARSARSRAAATPPGSEPRGGSVGRSRSTSRTGSVRR